MKPEPARNTNHHLVATSGKMVSFREPHEEDFHPATYSLESEKEIQSLWYTPEEQQHMLREYKMTSEIQILVETLQVERAHRLSNILLKAQKRSERRSSSSSSPNHKRRKGSPSRKREDIQQSSSRSHLRSRYDSAALSKLIVQLSSQRNRISHLTTSESVKHMIHSISSTNEPDLLDESSVDSQEVAEVSGELRRAKQKYNRLFRQLNRALAAR